MQKRILLNFSYLYFFINYINLPSFKSLKLLLFLQKLTYPAMSNLSYNKFFFNTKSDFLTNGGTLSFFFKSVTTKLLSTNPYQANFSLSVGLRKIYKGFDTRLIRIKKSPINFTLLYSDLVNTSMLTTFNNYSVTTASVNNIKYKNKKWKSVYSGGSFFYIKWYRSFNYFFLNSRSKTLYGSNTNINFRLNKSEDAQITDLLTNELNCIGAHIDTESKKPIGDDVHELFYISVYSYFFFLELILRLGFSLELFFHFWKQSLYNLDTLEDFLYDGFEPAYDFNCDSCNQESFVNSHTETGFLRSGILCGTFLARPVGGLSILSYNAKYYAANRLNTLFIISFFKLNPQSLAEFLFFFSQYVEHQKLFVAIFTKTSIVSGFYYITKLQMCLDLELHILQKFEFFSPTPLYPAPSILFLNTNVLSPSFLCFNNSYYNLFKIKRKQLSGLLTTLLYY